MFQKEVAQRLAAKPRTKDYGRLSVVTQWLAEVELLFDVSPQGLRAAAQGDLDGGAAFAPASPLAPCDIKDLERVTAAGFGQRRKMLRQSLKPLGGAGADSSGGVIETARAEELSVEQFCDSGPRAGDSRRAGG